MRIAIVDDDLSCVQVLQGHLKRFAAEAGVETTVTVHGNGISFLEDRHEYDVIFLDIDMPLMNGLDAARKLREKDEGAVLIFVTSLAQYALRGYEVNAMDFMVKPVSYSAFQFTMKRAEKASSGKKKAELVIETREGFVRRSADELLYVEVQGHNLTYHFPDGTITARGKLSSTEEKLRSSGFLRCNNCYLLNPRHIRTVKGYEVVIGGDTLAISHPRKKQFMEELGRWYAEFGG